MRLALLLIILAISSIAVSAAIPPPAAAPSFGSSSSGSSSSTTSTTSTTISDDADEEAVLPPSPSAPGVEAEPVESLSPSVSIFTPQFIIIQAEIALISLTGALMWFFGRNKHQTTHPSNSNNQLKSYVKNMMARGYSRSQLQQTLLSAGHEMSEIIEAFK